MIYASLAPVSQPPPNLAGGLGGYPPVPVELCTCNRLELMYRTGWFVKIVPIWPRYPMYTDNVDILNFLLLFLKGKYLEANQTHVHTGNWPSKHVILKTWMDLQISSEVNGKNKNRPPIYLLLVDKIQRIGTSGNFTQTKTGCFKNISNNL